MPRACPLSSVPARLNRLRYIDARKATHQREEHMAQAASEGVYRVIDVIGSSPVSWEDAAKSAIETASKSLRDLRIAEVEQLDLKIEDGRVVAYRARLQLSFKYEG
jgi:flavin-binding protein dodecin